MESEQLERKRMWSACGCEIYSTLCLLSNLVGREHLGTAMGFLLYRSSALYRCPLFCIVLFPCLARLL
jgi:hypothetical protein